MVILINNKKAVLKKGLSFDFIAENRFFTGADSYTLSITFPLAGCPQNIDIFGYINRKDYDLDKLLLDCEIHDKNFHAYGSVSIVDINETEVKTQFLEGRSATNFHSSFDDVYINEIPMPSIKNEAHFSTEYYMRSYREQVLDQQSGNHAYLGYVVFPWVNNTSGNIQNPMRRIEQSGHYYFTGGEDPDILGQPFLMEVLKQVFAYLGYSFDSSVFDDTWWENIVICNSLPLVWRLWNMNEVLPHWTVSEFLEQVELFIGGEFLINSRSKRVEWTFHFSTIGNLPSYNINKVVDSYKVEIKDADSKVSNEYFERRNLAYAECDHQMWKYYSCPWLRKKTKVVIWHNASSMYSTLKNYLTWDRPLDHMYFKRVHYCEENDTHFVLKCIHISGSTHKMRILPVDVFGPRIIEGNEQGEKTEIKIVPACIDYAGVSNGDMLFVECGKYDNDVEDFSNIDQTVPVNLLSAGETEQKEAFFDKLYVGFWNGNYSWQDPYMPHPIIDRYEFLPNGTLKSTIHSMRLKGTRAPGVRNAQYGVDQTKKYTFSFLSDVIPDAKSIFFIHGKKYLAEKITASFTEDGMSQLMKITCYRMKEPDSVNS